MLVFVAALCKEFKFHLICLGYRLNLYMPPLIGHSLPLVVYTLLQAFGPSI